jgi:hypothetical protein
VRPLVSIALLSLLAGCDRLPFGQSVEESAARACEGALKPTLVSPSSYRRVWFDYTPREPVTKDEMIEKLETDRTRAIKEGDDAEAFSSAYALQCYKKNKCDSFPKFEELHPPKTGFILLEYESENAFGASLPGFFICRLNQSDDGKYGENSVFTSGAIPRQLGEQTKAQYEAMK